MKIAQDTFTAQMPDGSFKHVTKGDWLPDNHELVKRDADPALGSGVLFKAAEVEDDKPARRGRSS